MSDENDRGRELSVFLSGPFAWSTGLPLHTEGGGIMRVVPNRRAAKLLF